MSEGVFYLLKTGFFIPNNHELCEEAENGFNRIHGIKKINND